MEFIEIENWRSKNYDSILEEIKSHIPLNYGILTYEDFQYNKFCIRLFVRKQFRNRFSSKPISFLMTVKNCPDHFLSRKDFSISKVKGHSFGYRIQTKEKGTSLFVNKTILLDRIGKIAEIEVENCRIAKENLLRKKSIEEKIKESREFVKSLLPEGFSTTIFSDLTYKVDGKPDSSINVSYGLNEGEIGRGTITLSLDKEEFISFLNSGAIDFAVMELNNVSTFKKHG